MAKWVGVAVALLALGLGLVAGCGDDEDCINTSGTWFLTTDLSDGAYTDDQCSVSQRGCDITVACQNGTTSYGEVDGNQVSFPISWLSGSGNSPTVNRGHCVLEMVGEVTLSAKGGALGCGLDGAALTPSRVEMTCYEVGNATWTRQAAPAADACPFETDFRQSYAVEQAKCTLMLDTSEQGFGIESWVTIAKDSLKVTWMEITGATGTEGKVIPGSVKIDEAGDGTRYLNMGMTYDKPGCAQCRSDLEACNAGCAEDASGDNCRKQCGEDNHDFCREFCMQMCDIQYSVPQPL